MKKPTGVPQFQHQAEGGLDNMNEHFEASCLCGGITLSYSGRIGPSNYCHCEDCRRANGSAFNIGVRVDRKDLKVKTTAEMRSYKFVSASGGEIERYFCGTCGSPIFTLHPAKQEYAWVKAGIINQPDIVKPTYENCIKDKVKWATITDICRFLLAALDTGFAACFLIPSRWPGANVIGGADLSIGPLDARPVA